jgi:hypothetical protein
MKSISKYSFIILYSIIGFFSFISCNQNKILDKSIEQTFIEFPSSEISKTISYSQKDTFLLAIPIQIFGKELENNSSIKFSIVGGTAKNKIHFNLDSIQEIKSKISLDTIFIHIATQKLTSGVDYSIKLEIKNINNTLVVSTNYKSCTIHFIKETFIDFYTGFYSCFESSTNSTYTVEFTKENSSTINNTNFWDFPNEGKEVPYIFNQDLNQTIEIPRTAWMDKLGKEYTVYGNGNYTNNGNFTVDFYIEDSNGNLYQNGTHTFTKK